MKEEITLVMRIWSYGNEPAAAAADAESRDMGENYSYRMTPETKTSDPGYVSEYKSLELI